LTATLLEAALKYARSGRAVFPCASDKSPMVKGGFKSATCEPGMIQMWDWGAGMIGAEIPKGQIVVDIDPRNGGLDTLKLLPRDLPPTKLARTRSGGSHAYYAVDPELELRSTLGPGVDVKQHGKGYVIVPPSEGYEWAQVGVANPAPQWLLDELVVEKRESSSELSSPKYFEFESGTPYGQSALERELGRLATEHEGGRNNALNRAAFAMGQLSAGGELNAAAAAEALLDVALKIGLEEPEARKTIASGFLAGEQEPRQAPELEPVAGLTEFIRTNLGDAEAEGRFWVDWNIEEAEPPFYLHPVLPKNAYVLVYGATEAAKSMTTLGILAEGSRRGIKSSIYSLENPPATDRDRLRRWGPDPENLRLTNEPLDFNNQTQVEALIEREGTWGTDIILIDTYSHAFGSRSEDGNARAIEFARRVRYVMASVGCTVVVIDHTGYAQEIDPRDASAKRQQVDVAVLMKKRGEWVFGQPARFSMKNHKAARFANPFYLEGEISDVKDRGLALTWTTGQELKWPES
jgi:hypothetical protein